MKKKFLVPFISILNCICLVLLCSGLTGCADDSLSEADSQLFQIACTKIKENAASDNSIDSVQFQNMVCEYDSEKYGTKVLATEIRANGYDTPYPDGNYLSYTVTFVTKVRGNTNKKITVSAVLSFGLSNETMERKIANYIFCTTDSDSRTTANMKHCSSYQYSKRAISAQEFVTLVSTGELDGHNVGLGGDKIPSFQIYKAKTASNYPGNGLKTLNVLSVLYDGSYHEDATTISSTQKNMCYTAIGELLAQITGVDADGNEITNYRAKAVHYLTSKMQGPQIAADSNAVFRGELVDDYFENNTIYDFDGDTNTAMVGCQATFYLTLKNAYQYNATYTFTASHSSEGSEETWVITDTNTNESFTLDNEVFIPAEIA